MTSTRPSLWQFFRVWLTLGCQSFGGGMATLALIRRAVVEQHGWVSEADFTRDWALVQVAPGINLLGLIILIGRNVAGARGVFLALFGLLFPSVTIAILLTLFYTHVQSAPVVQAALRGVLPAVLGIGLLTSGQMARPPLQESRLESPSSLGLSLFLLIGSGLALALWRWPVLLILNVVGLISAFAAWRRSSPPGPRSHSTRGEKSLSSPPPAHTESEEEIERTDEKAQ